VSYHEGNKYLLKRLEGIQKELNSRYDGNTYGSNATKGKEREDFINLFLSKILPSQFRFGSGEITDLSGNISGQVDIVTEYPLLPSITFPETNANTRLYLAEGVAASIEVKSNLNKQWNEVEKTSENIKKLRRRFSNTSGMAPQQIPLFAVGYKGWKTVKPLEEKIKAGIVDGILIIENGLFVWNHLVLPVSQLSGIIPKGPWALWGLIVALNRLATSLKYTSLDLVLYARPDWMIIKRLCNKVNDDDSVEVNFIETLHEEGIYDAEEIDKILESLKKENFIQISSHTTNNIYVKITCEAIEFTKFMITP